MIIGIDASRANKDQRTGVENYAFFLIETLKKIPITNHQSPITFILYSQEPLKGDLALLPSNWQSKVLRWPPKRLWTQVRLSWEMLVNRADVLFIPAHVYPLIHPKKTVMTIHDVAAAKFPESYNWFEKWYSLWSAKAAMQKLWRVVVPSEHTKAELLKLKNPRRFDRDKQKSKIKTDGIVVITHGYDRRYRVTEDQEAIEKVLNKYGFQRPFLLSVGRWETKKNTARIIQAFAELQKITDYRLSITDFQLVLIGKPGHGYEEVKRTYENSEHKDRIKMPGYVNPKDLVYLMNAAECFVFPSLYEGFGLSVLEALACGTPVVAGRGSSLEDIGGAACVYVDPMRVDSIAGGIEIVLKDQELRIKNQGVGLERVKKFSWEKCASLTLQLLLKD